MNILITGANGQLGNEMRIVSRSTTDNYIFTDVCQVEGLETTFLDITDMDAVRAIIRKHSVDIVVNCAAYTNVDAAEDNEPLAEKLNALAPRNLAVAMKEVGGLLIHISTDYVFGGAMNNTPCKEDQQGMPTGVYGRTKLHGEENVISSGADYIILRTAWLYSEFGKNFVKTMLNLTATKPQLKVVFDQVGTPTYALDLAKTIFVILDDYRQYKQTLDSKPSAPNYANNGIYHYSNEGVCSWYDFTKIIAEYAGNHKCDIQPCHSDEFPSSVTRPAYSVLDKTKVKQVFGISVPYWTDSLRTCIANIKSKQE